MRGLPSLQGSFSSLSKGNIKIIKDLDAFDVGGLQRSLVATDAMGSTVSPGFVREFQHTRGMLYAGGSTLDVDVTSIEATQNSTIQVGRNRASADHIKARVAAALGKKVKAVVGKMKYTERGKNATYSAKHFKYDIEKGYIALTPPTS